jgi:hypothetical protein
MAMNQPRFGDMNRPHSTGEDDWNLTDEERERLIREYRRDLPRLDREYEAAAKAAYRRAGIPPLPNWSDD